MAALLLRCPGTSGRLALRMLLCAAMFGLVKRRRCSFAGEGGARWSTASVGRRCSVVEKSAGAFAIAGRNRGAAGQYVHCGFMWPDRAGFASLSLFGSR